MQSTLETYQSKQTKNITVLLLAEVARVLLNFGSSSDRK